MNLPIIISIMQTLNNYLRDFFLVFLVFLVFLDLDLNLYSSKYKASSSVSSTSLFLNCIKCVLNADKSNTKSVLIILL